MEELEEKCRHFEISKKQRKDEVSYGWGHKGTRGYEEMGCYICSGYNDTCRSYYKGNKNKTVKREAER